MVVIVFGGFIIDELLNQIEQVLIVVCGWDVVNCVVIMEVEGDFDVVDEYGKILLLKVEFKFLVGDWQSDGNFLEYIEVCGNFIRFGFCFVFLFVGWFQEMIYVIVKMLFEVVESQVFGFDWFKYDDFVNLYILLLWELKYWVFKFQFV